MEIRSIEQKQKAVDKFQPDYMDDDIVLIDNFMTCRNIIMKMIL